MLELRHCGDFMDAGDALRADLTAAQKKEMIVVSDTSLLVNRLTTCVWHCLLARRDKTEIR
jgi:uncharacterized membrane protein